MFTSSTLSIHHNLNKTLAHRVVSEILIGYKEHDSITDRTPRLFGVQQGNNLPKFLGPTDVEKI